MEFVTLCAFVDFQKPTVSILVSHSGTFGHRHCGVVIFPPALLAAGLGFHGLTHGFDSGSSSNKLIQNHITRWKSLSHQGERL
jgi:hypothetical protein